MKPLVSLAAALCLTTGVALAESRAEAATEPKAEVHAASHAIHSQPKAPEDLWKSLSAGNARFVAGKLSYGRLKEQRAAVAPHQDPKVSILSCADSRVPPELVFDKTVGELFVVRAAGNVADSFGVASLEFAVVSGYTKMIVVLAHEACGAVRAALAPGDPGTPNLDALVAEIRESFDASVQRGNKDAGNEFHATMLNARHAADELLAKSETIRRAVEEKRVRLVTAYYDLDTGKVELIRTNVSSDAKPAEDE